MKPEDVALAIIAILTLVINVIPPIANLPQVPPEYSVVLLSIAAILKAILGDLQREETEPPPPAG